jgi:hypothetical protein
MELQAYKEANIKLGNRFRVLKQKLLAMHAEPLNWPIANDPIFVRVVNTTLDNEPTPENIEEITSSINRLILAIDGQIPTMSLAV